ncbi:MAG: Grx4 family monothiol glutaredoxin [Candidatus Omnitrophota bacterium]|nr:Grx4 family monothiol glutaredoxin [Candidatus Omnitrophota bacterium]MDZ4242628.1 Grx4 family monothiol glutaredoxin [Candidatus Omnitrophota bacterium]
MDEALKQRIDQDIKNNKVVLYMKGKTAAPMCGFSARAVSILQKHDTAFKDVNILEDEAIRQGMKEYSDWPTFPQIYINGEFIGGCDILAELDENGELAKLLGKAK